MVPGQIIDGRFVLDRLVALGGMAEVHRAHDRETGGVVAIKVWNGIGDNAGRFEREARVLERLDHEAIVRYVAHGATPEGELFLAMEWLAGVDLAARLATDGLTIAETVSAIARAAEGLASAHAMGVVHRDLKPSNLFLVEGEPAKLKVLDFGVARFRETDPTASHRPETHGGVVLGTPDYMAPEQARGEATIDARADVFALGAVLFECLTGRGAFSGNDLVTVLARVMLEEIPRVRTLRPEVPAALDELVARMLEKLPSARPQSVVEVAALLRAIAPLARDGDDAVSSRPRAPSLRREKSLVSVVAVAPEAGDARATSHTLAAGSLPGARSRQARVARTFGVRTSTLDDGTTAFVVRHGPAIDRAPHAARCALALHDGRARIAIVTGEGLLDGDRLDASALIGDAHRRLAPASGPIVIDDATRALLDRRFTIERGHDGFVLRGALQQGDDLRTRLGTPLPFVGRERELSTLTSLLEHCASDSQARVVLITGSPGVGKSRLAAELVARLAGETILARGETTTCSTPLSLVRGLLRNATLDGDVHDVEGSLRALLGDTRGPVTLVIDDLHHGDLPSIQLLERALREHGDRPVLLVGLARPELGRIFPGCFRERGVQELPLGELSRTAVATLVHHARGEPPSETLLAEVWARCQGNPFVLEALLHDGEAAAARLGEVVEQARLDGLDPEARRVLRVASALPEPFSSKCLHHVLDPLPDVDVILAELVEHDLLARVRDDDEPAPAEARFVFARQVVRAAAAMTLPDADRAYVVTRAATIPAATRSRA